MKKTFLLTTLTVFFLLGAMLTPANAQAEPGQIVWINSPISAELRAALDTWLTNPPTPQKYYAVTYSQKTGNNYYVSLVALDLQNENEQWSFTGIETYDENGNIIYINKVTWFETILVHPDGMIEYPFGNSQAHAPKIAMPAFIDHTGAGGGSYVRFPWQPSKMVRWTVLGVHGGGDLATTPGTWRAVDLESGSDFGSGAANDIVYASTGGIIQAICADDNSVAVRIGNSQDQFIYGNMQDNANLTINHSFTAGQKISSAVHGTFIGQCGNAIQQDDRWALHWGFVTLDNSFQAEGCRLTNPVGDKWHWMCGNTRTDPLGVLYHYGNVGQTPGDPNEGLVDGAGGGPSFWAYFLEGVQGIFNALFLDSLPENNVQLDQLFSGIFTSIKIVFRISYMLMRGNLNLAPTMNFLFVGIAIVLVIRGIAVVFYIVRVIKAIPFL